MGTIGKLLQAHVQYPDIFDNYEAFFNNRFQVYCHKSN